MKISKEKRDRISEQVLAFLFSTTPKQFFTADIAREVARDEEFIKKMLHDLKGKGLVTQTNKNPKGREYSRRLRWKLSDKAYLAYKDADSQRQ